MTADVRQKALAVLTEVAALAPDVRLGQLMAHLGFLGEDQVERTLWDIEDDELLAVLNRHRSELVARQEETPNNVLQPTGHAKGGTSSPNVKPA